MREIKFRAWDKVDKCWLHLTGLAFDLNEAVVRTTGYNTIVSLEVIELTQYTGLKDKIGNKIYEGDIIKKEETLWKIIWVETRAAFCKKRIEKFDGRIPSPIPIDQYWMALVEVIGNIYENPNLIPHENPQPGT